ncbi:MAG: FAD-dependent oxidoreductase, partial [Dehalococcoidia bacterium]
MRPSLDEIARQSFDVTVIGGGINGAGVAAEAAQRGYRTLLIERRDFAAGTTSRATRLIHGGLRYLEHGEFGLVYESLGERETLVREAPHLVRPLRLLVPVYRDDRRPPWMVRAGLVMYDALSFRKSLPRHRAMPPAALSAYEPGLSRDGLRAAYTFYDAQVEFPERLVIESLRAFIDAGGVAMNHASCERIVSPGGVLRGLVVRDELSGETAQVDTRVAVNAAGPWVDQVLGGSDAERHERLIGGTKGS